MEKKRKNVEEFFSRVFTQGGKGRRRRKAFFDLASFDEEMSLAAPPRITVAPSNEKLQEGRKRWSFSLFLSFFHPFSSRNKNAFRVSREKKNCRSCEVN